MLMFAVLSACLALTPAGRLLGTSHPTGRLLATSLPPFMNVVDMKPAWPNSFLSIQPTFTVQDWPKAKIFMGEYLDRTRTERCPMYSGWTICGSKLFCREAFPDGDAVVTHLRPRWGWGGSPHLPSTRHWSLKPLASAFAKVCLLKLSPRAALTL